jgi:cytochrome c-type biogenesis protein CcmH/NrfG
MNPQKNQETEAPQMLQDLQAEVSAESAPLLRFILNNASVISGAVIIFLLVLGGTGVWNWYSDKKSDEAKQNLARIVQSDTGADRIKALKDLAAAAPDSVKLSVYFTLGLAALENGEYGLAAEAYANAAQIDKEGALGLTAMLGEAGVLLKAGKHAEALDLLQELYARMKATNQSPQLRQMLAEAAAGAGKTELAVQTYQALARELPGVEGEYFSARAAALADEPTGK